MGDNIDKEFSKEELETLGESSEEEGPDTQDEEQSGDEQESETEQASEQEQEGEQEGEEDEQAEVDEEGNVIPYSRFKKEYASRKELERKHDLLKRDPEAYRKLYPDEFEDKGEEKPSVGIKSSEAANMVVQGGQHDGKTLAEVYDEDPFAATDLYLEYRDSQKKEAEQQANLQKQSQEELKNFSDELAQELFEKGLDALGPKEGKEIDGVIDSVLGWMEETGRGGGNVADAYFLMNKERILQNAAEKGVKSLVDKSSKGQVRTVNSGKGQTEKSGYGRFMDFTADQLTDYIENLSDTEAEKFMAKAPQELKDKFPKAFAAWE